MTADRSAGPVTHCCLAAQSAGAYNRVSDIRRHSDHDTAGLDRRIRRTEINAAGTIVKQERFLYERNLVADPDADTLLPRPRSDATSAGDPAALWSVALTIDETPVAVSPASASATSARVSHRYFNGPLIDQVFSDQTATGIAWYLQRDSTIHPIRKVTVGGTSGMRE